MQMPRNGRLVDRRFQPGDPGQRRAPRGKGAVAGQHQMIGARHILGPGRDDDPAGAGFGRDPLEGLGGRMQVARFVVDDDRQHPTVFPNRLLKKHFGQCRAG